MHEENLDRFARGGLSPLESRELAQRALDDPALFEELTATALARTVLWSPGRERNVWPRIVVVASAGLAAMLLVSIFALRRPQQTPAAVATISGPPIFLARNSAGNSAVFRGADEDSRAPRIGGSVTAVADGMVTIDLGSLDGLAKDGEVEVVRAGKTIGTIHLTSIFRERARAVAPAGVTVLANDQIRVLSAMYLRAVLDQIEALSARGDSAGALRIAQQAANRNFDVALREYDDWNNLGGIAELRGDKAKAQSFYEQALRANPPDQARHKIETNLARLKGSK
jgi:hypothetical protein